MPNVNFNFSGSILVFIGSIAFSYYTHIGWWALGGLSYLAYARVSDTNYISEVFDYILLVASIVFFAVAAVKMGWVF